jgi:putative protein kinase ArgK-like GTPase of G3E family
MSMLSMSGRSANGLARERELVMAQANCDKGTDDLAVAVLKHHELVVSSGELEKRRQERAKLELSWAVDDYLNKYIDKMDQGQLANMVNDLAQRKTNPRSIVSEIIARMSAGGRDGLFAD